MTYSEKVANKLNDLLKKNYDAQKGFTLAAGKVETPSVKTFLKNKAEQRQGFVNDLKNEIREYGKSAEEDGSLKGDLHRTWMSLLATFPGNETEKILEEVERGERSSLNEYNDILKNKEIVLPASTKKVLLKHRDGIRAALSTAKAYEELVS